LDSGKISWRLGREGQGGRGNDIKINFGDFNIVFNRDRSINKIYNLKRTITLCYGVITAAGAVESGGRNAMKPDRFAKIAHPAISLAMVMAGSQTG
jgi:lipid-binding SYLF domain-containing protein